MNSKSFIVTIGLLGGALAGPVEAQVFKRNMMGGSGTSTYLKIANDIRGVTQKCDVPFGIVSAGGGLENFLGVRTRPFTQIGLSRNDVLEYMGTFSSSDPVIAEAAEGMRVALPLYDEEVQVLATRDIDTLQDLAGKRVGIGPRESGTFLTASLVLDLVGVEDVERVETLHSQTLPAFLDGEIDAFFRVAGAPNPQLEDPRIDPERHHLVPVTDPVLRSVYEPVTLPADTYAYQDEPVETVAAKALLVTYEYDPRTSGYHQDSCDAVADLTHLISTSFEELRADGHPKWDDVDLTELPPGWSMSACARRGLEPTYQPVCDVSESNTRRGPVEDASEIYRERICQELGGC